MHNQRCGDFVEKMGDITQNSLIERKIKKCKRVFKIMRNR